MKVAVCFCSFFLCISIAIAENCPKYPSRDKRIIRNLFLSQGPGGGFYIADGSGIMEILTRLANIAYLSSGTAAILSSSENQHLARSALDSEYQALVKAIDEFAGSSKVSVSPRTRAFLRQIVNSQYLGLRGTTVTGFDNQEAGRNADAAVSKIGVAIARLWQCY